MADDVGRPGSWEQVSDPLTSNPREFRHHDCPRESALDGGLHTFRSGGVKPGAERLALA